MYNLKNNFHIGIKRFPYKTRHSQLSKDIYFVEIGQRMKELCPIEVKKIFGLKSLYILEIASKCLQMIFIKNNPLKHA